MNRTKQIFRMSQIGPGISVSGHKLNGASQPPRNRTEVKALIKIMFMYSPRKNSANAIDEYSTLKPVTSEASSSGRSNGCRLVSARIEATKIMNIGKCGTTYQRCRCDQTMSERLSDPAVTSTVRMMMPIEI